MRPGPAEARCGDARGNARVVSLVRSGSRAMSDDRLCRACRGRRSRGLLRVVAAVFRVPWVLNELRCVGISYTYVYRLVRTESEMTSGRLKLRTPPSHNLFSMDLLSRLAGHP